MATLNPVLPNISSTTRERVTFVVTLALTDLSKKIINLVRIILLSIGIDYVKERSWWNVIPLPSAASQESGSQENNPAKLYLSALPLTRDSFGMKVDHADVLQKLGVQSVLSATKAFETSYKSCLAVAVDQNKWEAKGINRLQLEISDFEPVPMDEIAKGVDFVHRSLQGQKSVLVHCKAGVGRSTTIVICYLIKHKGMSAEDAFKHVKSHRIEIRLDQHQWKRVKEYEALCNSFLTRR